MNKMGNETSVTCGSTKRTPEQDEYISIYSWWLEIIGNLPIGCVGIIFNLLAIIILTSSTLWNNFFNRLLVCLAIFDTLYISCDISEVFRHEYESFVQQHMYVNFVNPVRHIFMCSSTYMTIVLAYERYQSITDPVQYRIRERTEDMTKRLFKYVFPVMLFTCCYYSPKFFEMKVCEVMKCSDGNKTDSCENLEKLNYVNIDNKMCTTNYTISTQELRRNIHYIFWYLNVSNLILTVILPSAVLMYLNWKIILSLNTFSERQSSRPRPSKKTKVLFSIVILFAICHSLRVILNTEEFIYLTRNGLWDEANFKEAKNKKCGYEQERIWTRYLVPLGALLVVTNSSLNFFIYVFFDSDFQRVFREKLSSLNILSNTVIVSFC